MLALRTLLLVVAIAAAIDLGGCVPAAAQISTTGSHGVIFNAPIADDSFNELVNAGVQRFRAETGVLPRVSIIFKPEFMLRRMEDFVQVGVEHLMLVGLHEDGLLLDFAARHPRLKITLIDAALEAPNVAGVVFAEEEVAFLAGVAAAAAVPDAVAMAALGGMAVPPVRRFLSGFCQGVAALRPDVPVRFGYVGTTVRGFFDRAEAARQATALTGAGARVLFVAAGFAGRGAIDVAVAAGGFAVGVDTNQNAVAPGRIITSALKHADIASYRMLLAAHQGTWAPGVIRLGFADGAVGLSRDAHNAAVFAPAEAVVAEFETRLRNGRLPIARPDDAGACAA